MDWITNNLIHVTYFNIFSMPLHQIFSAPNNDIMLPLFCGPKNIAINGPEDYFCETSFRDSDWTRKWDIGQKYLAGIDTKCVRAATAIISPEISNILIMPKIIFMVSFTCRSWSPKHEDIIHFKIWPKIDWVMVQNTLLKSRRGHK